MIHWAWLILAFFGGSIFAVVIMALLNYSAMREMEHEHLQRLMEQYPLPQPPGKTGKQAEENSTETKSVASL